jgi:hypothetical protein
VDRESENNTIQQSQTV